LTPPRRPESSSSVEVPPPDENYAPFAHKLRTVVIALTGPAVKVRTFCTNCGWSLEYDGVTRICEPEVQR